MSCSDKFSKNINELLIATDNKRLEVYKDIGINARSLSVASNYGIIPSVGSLLKIADYFKVSVDFLLGLTEEKFYKVNEAKVSFKTRINELCKEKNVTVYRLSQECNLISNYVYRWKNEKNYPTVDNLLKISKFFGVSIDYLLGRTDYKH